VSELAKVEVSEVDGFHLVRVSGEIDLSNARDVMDSIGRGVPSDASLVLVDLTDTSYLDSAGISMLFRLGERLHYSRQELRLVVPRRSTIRAVLEMTRLTSVIPVAETLDEGVAWEN
jgi:anti-anti-sigma factor